MLSQVMQALSGVIAQTGIGPIDKFFETAETALKGGLLIVATLAVIWSCYHLMLSISNPGHRTKGIMGIILAALGYALALGAEDLVQMFV